VLHTGERIFFTRVLSAHESTALTLEDTCTPGIIRLRIENADVEIAVLLDQGEAAWLRDRLLEGVAEPTPSRIDASVN
jgi:hypothetical protein